MGKARGTWLVLGILFGLVVGLNLAGVWPQIPVHAVATHGQENFAICTGPMDADTEGVYLLDYLTGDLKCAVLSQQTGKFNSFFETNVAKDLEVASGKNPKFLMVPGVIDLRRGAGVAQLQPSSAVVYVAEVTSGNMAAYGIMWSPQMWKSGTQQSQPIVMLDKLKFRKAPIRGAGGKGAKAAKD